MLRMTFTLASLILFVIFSSSAQSKDQQIKDLKAQLDKSQQELIRAQETIEKQKQIAAANEEQARRQEQIAIENAKRAEMHALEAKGMEELSRMNEIRAQQALDKVKNDLRNTKNPLKHLVMVKFKAGTSDSNISKFTDAFLSLKESIPFVLSIHTGVNNSPENLNRGLTHVYVVAFKNEADRDKYLVHDQHKKFAKTVEELGVIEEVFVFDYTPNR